MAKEGGRGKVHIVTPTRFARQFGLSSRAVFAWLRKAPFQRFVVMVGGRPKIDAEAFERAFSRKRALS